ARPECISVFSGPGGRPTALVAGSSSASFREVSGRPDSLRRLFHADVRLGSSITHAAPLSSSTLALKAEDGALALYDVGTRSLMRLAEAKALPPGWRLARAGGRVALLPAQGQPGGIRTLDQGGT